jgi:pantetheine-phosphate adenylyltransferase
MRAVYPGSFDPPTHGHLDIIKRAAKNFTEVLVLISENPEKKGRITLADRIKLLEDTTRELDNVKVASFSGLTVDYVKMNSYDVLLRALRDSSDFEAELGMSQINQKLSGIETLFLMTDPQYSFIRSSRVWELIRFNGDISNMVPESVKSHLLKKLNKK